VIYLSVKNNIKILRAEKNMSQKDLAKQVHVTQTAVSQWEMGKTNPDIKTADKLALYFDVSVDFLLGRTSERIKSCYNNTLNNGYFVQGNGTISVGKDTHVSKEEAKILKVYRTIDVRSRAKLMNLVFELEDSASISFGGEN
jgi:transcriptional regulator with XRE-family HTH domain